MSKHTWLPFLLLLGVVAWFLFGIRDRGGRPLRIIWGYDPELYDPHQTSNPVAHEVFRHVCEPLFYFDDAREVYGLIAKDEVQFSPDGLTLQIWIRGGIQFHDGTDVTPEAVKESFNQIQQSAISPLNEEMKNVSILLGGNNDIIFQLEQPDYGFIERVLTHEYATIQRTADAENETIFPICSGPYQFVPDRYEPDKKITIERFKAYASPRLFYENRVAQIPEIEFVFVDNPDERFAQLLSTEACVLSLDKDAIPLAEKIEYLTLYENMGGVTYLGFNFSQTRWQEPNVREAIVNAIDKGTMAESGPFFAADTLLTPNMVGYTETVSQFSAQYNPTASEQTLRDIGFDFDEEVIVLIPESRTYTALFEFIKADLNAIGLSNVVLRSAPRTEISTMRQHYDLLFHDYAWTDFASMQRFLRPGTTQNLLNYPNDDIAEIVKEAALTADSGQRTEMIEIAQKTVFEKHIYEPIIIRKLVTAVNNQCVSGENRVSVFPLYYQDATTTTLRRDQ